MPRPRSESFYLNLAPNVSAALSIHTKASLSVPRSPLSTQPPTSPPPPPRAPTSPTRSFPFSRTPSIRTVPPAEDADDERDLPRSPAPFPARKRSSHPDLRFAHCSQLQFQLPPTRCYPWSPTAPSPLRRDASKPFCPSSLFTTNPVLLPLYPIPSTPPRPLHPLSTGPASTLELESAALGQCLKAPSRRRTPLLASTLKKSFLAGAAGSSVRRFGVRTAWNIDEDVRRSLATAHLHSIFEFTSSDENDDDDNQDEDEDDEFHSSSKGAISKVQVYPEIRTASRHMRSPSETSEEDISSGSDGGEECSSTQFDGDSSDEEEGLPLENRDTWELITI